jgi:hypothetical protein
MRKKNRNKKDEKEGERRKTIKDQIDKRRKANKTLSQKSKKGAEKTLIKGTKRE